MCPDTTFVVLPDVVTHLTSEVLVVKGGADAVSFEYTLEKLDVQVNEEEEEEEEQEEEEEEGDGQSGGGDGGSGSSGDGAGGSGSSPSSSSSPSASSPSSHASRTSSVSASSAASAGDSRVWQRGDASGVIHLHHLQVCMSGAACGRVREVYVSACRACRWAGGRAGRRASAGAFFSPCFCSVLHFLLLVAFSGASAANMVAGFRTQPTGCVLTAVLRVVGVDSLVSVTC